MTNLFQYTAYKIYKLLREKNLILISEINEIVIFENQILLDTHLTCRNNLLQNSIISRDECPSSLKSWSTALYFATGGRTPHSYALLATIDSSSSFRKWYVSSLSPIVSISVNRINWTGHRRSRTSRRIFIICFWFTGVSFESSVVSLTSYLGRDWTQDFFWCGGTGWSYCGGLLCQVFRFLFLGETGCRATG